ncbi:MAG: hypothetical protein ACRC1M_02895 [Methanobacteriaceae archaeon]
MDNCDLSPNSVVVLTIIAKVVKAGNITNFATISSNTFDPNTSNNNANVSISAQKATDLVVTKTVNDTNPAISQNVSYIITVVNNGPDNATGVYVNDIIPESLTIVNVTASKGSYNKSTGIWTIGDLASNINITGNTSEGNTGEIVTLIINATLNNAGTWINNATVNGSEIDQNPTNNKGVAIINGSEMADLAISKVISITSAGNTTNPKNGAIINFTIIVTNNGPSNATGVYVNDTLISGINYINSTASKGTYDNNTGIWNIGSLNVDETVYINITAIISRAGELNNYALVNSTTEDLDLSDNGANLSFNVSKFVDINLTHTVNITLVSKGDFVNFTITVVNSGLDNATGVFVSDILPAGLNFISHYATKGIYDNNTGIWTIGELIGNNGESVVLNIITNTTVSNTVLVITAIGSSNEEPMNITISPNPLNPVNPMNIMSGSIMSAFSTPNIVSPLATSTDTLANNIATATVTVKPLNSELTIDLGIQDTVNNPSPYYGDTVEFTLTVTNNGPFNGTNITVNDTSSVGLLTLGVVSISQGSFNNSTGIWTIGNMTVGSTATIVLRALVTGLGSLNNYATVNSEEIDTNLSNNNNSATIFASPKADVAITKTVNNSAPYKGDIIKYTIKVSDNGPNSAGFIRVVDVLPNGLKYISSSATNGSYNVSTGLWTVGDLATGETAILTMIVKVMVENETIDNTASQVHRSGLDTNITNDYVEALIQVRANNIVLNEVKTVNTTKAHIGDNVKYIVTVSNIGNQTAPNVTVSDKIPNGLKLVKFAASTGTYNTDTGIWTIGDIGAGEVVTLTMIVKTQKIGEFANVAITKINGTENLTDKAIIEVVKKSNNNTNNSNNTNTSNSSNSANAHILNVPMAKTAIPIAVLLVVIVSTLLSSVGMRLWSKGSKKD